MGEGTLSIIVSTNLSIPIPFLAEVKIISSLVITSEASFKSGALSLLQGRINPSYSFK